MCMYILYMAQKRKNIMEFAGVFAENADEWKDIENRIYEDRKKSKLRTYKL